jgi:hypothetical protein
VPHYLLIVGDPKTIPFEFQYALSTIYAVGRVHFPSQEEYTAYAKSIVASETGQLTLARRVAVFAPQHEDDRAAKHTVTEFVTPLIKSLTAGQRGWSVRTYLQEHGTKAELAGLLGGPETPALLFATGHGMQYLSGDPAQLSRQGALVCSDWQRGPIAAEQIFAAADVAADARLLGVIAFIVGPYTAGTPEYAESLNLDIGFVEARPIAPHAFLARLPQRLLGHPEGGALGIVGHVERTWSGGFSGAKGGHEVDLFARVLQRLMQGAPLGAAMRPLFQRYADYAAQMPQEFEKVLNGRSRSQDRARFSRQLRAFYDARDYLILGDPAVRLMSTEEDPAIPSDPTTAGEAEPVIRNETEGS